MSKPNATPELVGVLDALVAGVEDETGRQRLATV